MHRFNPLFACPTLLTLACGDPSPAPSDAVVLDTAVIDAANDGLVTDAPRDVTSADAMSADSPRSDAGTRFEIPLPNGLACESNGRVAVRRSRNARAEYLLVRCLPEAGSICGGSCFQSAIYLAIRVDGVTYAVTSASLTMTSTHHNWCDAVYGTSADGVSLRWDMNLGDNECASMNPMTVGFAPGSIVRATRNGASVLAPTVLTETVCNGSGLYCELAEFSE